MKSAILFSFLLAISLAVTREDIRYCGLYESQCLVDPVVSKKQSITMSGMTHHQPIYEERTVTSYWGPACGDEAKLSTLTASMTVEPLNNVANRYFITIEKYVINFANEGAFKDYRCTIPLEVNVDYDVSKLECFDGAAEDPFAAMKAEIGVPQINEITFTEDAMILPVKTEELVLNRVDDTGCRS